MIVIGPRLHEMTTQGGCTPRDREKGQVATPAHAWLLRPCPCELSRVLANSRLNSGALTASARARGQRGQDLDHALATDDLICRSTFLHHPRSVLQYPARSCASSVSAAVATSLRSNSFCTPSAPSNSPNASDTEPSRPRRLGPWRPSHVGAQRADIQSPSSSFHQMQSHTTRPNPSNAQWVGARPGAIAARRDTVHRVKHSTPCYNSYKT